MFSNLVSEAILCEIHILLKKMRIRELFRRFDISAAIMLKKISLRGNLTKENFSGVLIPPRQGLWHELRKKPLTAAICPRNSNS